MLTISPKWLLVSVLVCLLFICCRQKSNRLEIATSPYLQQHADNPVDWYEWGEEALNKAKKENKPILVSIGFASCHWCHVMEEESFMDTTVARLMNENFVCIKVDREQRPDIDQIYMNACQLISGSSGWPLNAFALADGKPFYAGTYYSKKSWISLLKQVSTAFREQPGKVSLQANSITNGIAKLELNLLAAGVDSTGIQPRFYLSLIDSIYKKMDFVHGGLQGELKFPMPVVLELLLQHAAVSGDSIARNLATNSLTKMALGGIYDQAGGGFARYAVDSAWHVPHFEKMLYDNAQLISVYAHAWQLTGDRFYKTILEETLAFVQRELSAENGGYFCSLNADVKAGEGAYYTWTYDELKKTTGGDIFCKYFGVTPEGNFKREKTNGIGGGNGVPGKGNSHGENVLHGIAEPDVFAAEMNIQSGEFYNKLISAKQNMLRHRTQREAPAVDRKILASWNALMLNALADAYAALQDKTILEQAKTTASFIETNFIQRDGALFRNFSIGSVSVTGLLEDYALISKAYIRMYQVTFDKHWLTLAQNLSNYAIDHFYDPGSGMFYNTPANTEYVVVRKMSLVDESMPSANAVMAGVLYQLGLYFDQQSYLARSATMLSRIGKQVSRSVPYMAYWASLVGLQVYGTNEIVITGPEAIDKNLEMQKHFFPRNIYLGATSLENLPLMSGKLVKGKTYIYACVNRTCKKPVETVSEAIDQLN